MKRILLSLILLMPLIAGAVDYKYAVDKWQISKDEAVKHYLSGGSYTSVDIAGANYSNQIYDYILSINSELKSQIVVVRSDETPKRDLLFVNDKLCSVSEASSKVSNQRFKELFITIKDIYGNPKVEKKGETSTYTFNNSITNVLLTAKLDGNDYDVKIHYYPKALFRMLITE